MRAFALLLLLSAVEADAQVSSLLPGARVRLESRSYGQRLEGTVMAHSGDSIVIAQNGALRTSVTHASIYRVQTSSGKSRAAGAMKGAKIGALLSGGLGLSMALVVADQVDATSEEIAAFTGMYAISGAIWGLGIGALVGAEKWTTVYSEPLRLAIRVAPDRSAAVGLALKF